MTAIDARKAIQEILHVSADGIIGEKTLKTLNALSSLPDDASWPSEPTVIQGGRFLTGDGTWPYQPRIDGDDIILSNIVITCFGGNGDGTISDPQDSGATASGKNTKNHPFQGVSIAMDARQFPGMEQNDPAGFRALTGAPFPRIPWGTLVEVTINGITKTPADGILDLGPGKHASKPGEPHALDLTPIAAAMFAPNQSVRHLATTFEQRGSMRIIGGAKFVS